MSKITRINIGLTALLVVIYFTVLSYNRNEDVRRSLDLKEAPLAGDSFDISMRTISLDLASSQMAVRMDFRLNGRIAKDPATPAVDLKFFLNAIRGPQQIEFPRGRRMASIEAVFPLDGNLNRYPFDHYESSIQMLVTRPAHAAPRAQPSARKAASKAARSAMIGSDLLVPEGQMSEPVPMACSFAGSIPGLKFRGQRVERTEQGVEGFNLVIQRAANVVVMSIMIMVLMMSLAMSVFMMSVQALDVDKGQNDLLSLSLCVSLLFGLPALRNAQPAVPSLGAFGDFLSFLWAEVIVAVSAIMVIWTWMIRHRRDHQEDQRP